MTAYLEMGNKYVVVAHLLHLRPAKANHFLISLFFITGVGQDAREGRLQHEPEYPEQALHVRAQLGGRCEFNFCFMCDE